MGIFNESTANSFSALFNPDPLSDCNYVEADIQSLSTGSSVTQAFSSTPALSSDSAGDQVDNFNSKVTKIPGVIAPFKIKVISGKRKAPWRNALSVKHQKKECRKAKQTWRKNKAQGSSRHV